MEPMVFKYYVADYIFRLIELVLLAEDGGNFGSKERPIHIMSFWKVLG